MTKMPLKTTNGTTHADAIWQVAVPVPLRRYFAYRIDSSVSLQPGMRVLVPFGRRRITGYLMRLATEDELTGFTIKKAHALLDEQPLITPELLLFLERAARYYLHPPGEVLQTALPGGINPRERKGKLIAPRVTPKRKKQVRIVSTDYSDEMVRRAPMRAAILATIADATCIDINALRKIHPTAATHLKRLETDGLVTVETVADFDDPFGQTQVPRDTPPALNPEQRHSVDEICNALCTDRYHGFLLHGITGSGKTEVYLHAIAEAIQLGKGALVLVPEITLTPQLVQRYRARFGDRVAVLHSGLSDGDRFNQWQMLRNGQLQVAIGVRSAIFAPLDNPGIIVVDEEHDSSFKQETGFAYHARDLALLRGSRLGGVVVLGSATPSLESYHLTQTQKLRLLSLTTRATTGTLPVVDVINLKNHKGGPGHQNIISTPLYRQIETVLARDEQVILFLNRRGFAPSLLCKSCGEHISCDDCAVSMTLHRHHASKSSVAEPKSLQSLPQGDSRDRRHLCCHYCGRVKAVPTCCPSCGNANMHPIGTGTQKVEETVRALFPSARVGRLDRDTASGNRAEQLLADLRAHQIDILVGTQMITKGHDFPGVTLVGVLQSDVGLHMPDFRAGEKTFQLLTQVSGRAGRATLPGTSLIQTYSPDHPAVVFAREHDYLGFACQELISRRELGYPPFGRLVAIRINGIDPHVVEQTARDIAAALRDAWHRCKEPDVFILGPTAAPLAFIQNRHRWQLFLKAHTHTPIRKMLAHLEQKIEQTNGPVRIRIDVDPVSML